MTDDLTNPDVLMALEIAKVEYDGLDVDNNPARFRIVVDEDKRVVVERFEEFEEDGARVEAGWIGDHDATPADLDHALKEFLLWLKAKREYVSLAFEDGQWVVDAANHLEDVGRDGYVRGTGESPLLAVAAAVVKVGKETKHDNA